MKKSRILSWLLIVAMVFSLLPAVSFAEGESTLWTKVSFADIQPSDTVAITMTKEGTTYALPTTAAGSSGQPLAVVAEADADTLSTPGISGDFGWTIQAAEGGYTIACSNGYLHIVTGNNCVRVGETAAVWNLHEGGYLTTPDPGEVARYLGVYAGATPDWRCYKTYDTGNISGETLDFWVLDPGAVPPVTETTAPTETETEIPSESTEPTETTEPTVPPTQEGEQADLVTEVENGMSVYIYNPRNSAVLTAQASGTQLAAMTAVVENDQLTVEDSMEALTLIIDADGYCSFQNASGEYLTFGGSSNQLSFEAAESDGSLWTVEAAEGGFFIKSVSNSAMALEYYKGNFTVYSFQSYNPGAYLMQFFAASVGGFTDTLTAGDRVVIYNPTHSMALSCAIADTEKNQDLVGTELVLSNDSLSGYTEEHIWTVGANEDGTYTFTTAAGQKLAVVNRTHVGLDEENSLWTLEKLDGKTDEFFVKGPIGTYLEWYADKGYWSAFYNPTEELYAVRFYIVGGNVTPSNTVATPKASPRSGVVNSGTEISFTCATEGATILYRVGNGEWTEYTAPIAITEDTAFTVKAMKEGMDDSKEVTFTYTIYVPPVMGENQAQLVTDASQLASGDQIIIVTKDFDYSLGKTQKANNRDYGQVVKAYDRCSYDEGTQIITLESGVEANTFALYATGGDFPGYLYASTESGNLLRTQEGKDANASFTITIAADGSAAITSLADKKSNTIRYNTVGIFSCYGATGQKPVCIYKLDGQERPGLPESGDVVVIYNQSAKGVLSGMEGDISDVNSCSVKAAAATIANGKADCSNGALLFKVQKNGEYYRFYNESFGYLCATGTGNNAYYSMTASEDADWVVAEYNGGYTIGSRTAVFEGNQQFLQHYSGGFTTWGMTAVTDRDIFTYHFYPCANEKVTDGVVNAPYADFGNPSMAYAGQKYLLRFTVEALFGIKEIHAYLGSTELECSLSNGRYTAVIPAEYIVGESLSVTVKGVDNKNVAFESVAVIEVKDEPTIFDVSPMPNAQTKEDKRPVISAKLSNVGENPTIVLTVNGEAVKASYANSTVSYQAAEPMKDGNVSVSLTVTRADGKSVTKGWSFTVGEAKYQLLFGQLHSHTGEYSDGSGTLDSALEYIEKLPEEANVDFVAFTDHSNYFDTSSEPNPEAALFDASLCTPASFKLWNTYKTKMADFNASHTDIIAIPGFEMTWSGGPGHMNTFVTEGIVSRNNKTLNNKSADAGMRAYYDLLSTDAGVDSITQLNHPGTMFGNFTNFAYWNPLADTRVHLVEVGNGEGPIHGSGYYPSYDQYTLALDKGWHIAPTNNQDNHKARWGNGNEARDVVLAESFSEEAIYEAIRNYRVYATEDRNLELSYYVNDLPMGTEIENVPGKLSFRITMNDPDASDSIAKVELIVNSGKVAYTWDNAEDLSKGLVTAELEPEYSYYYVRVTQADKDIAVTAPIWVGESLKLGMRDASADTTSPVAGEELSIRATVYNEEAADAVIKSIVYTTNGSEVLYVDNNTYVVSALSEKELVWNYVPTAAKLMTITITAVVEYEGKEYTFSSSVELDVQNAEDICYLGIDASHANEYVSGYNKDLVKNFVSLAADASFRTEILSSSDALIAACKNEKFTVLVLNTPSRRLAEAKDYSEAELEALAAFHARGGMLIITGGGDSNDKLAPHIAATQNRLLKALGSSLRLQDDGTYEESSYGLSFGSYGTDPLTEGLSGSISYYGGSSVYAVDAEGKATATLPAGVSPLVFANASTISKDADSDGLGGNSTKYAYAPNDNRLLVMAAERFADKGMILVAGAAFMNDYDLKIPAETDNNALCENLLKAAKPVKITAISEVRAQTEEGFKFTIEGIVTSNASGYDKSTAFFDCIYVQDETAGINCFPVAGEYKLGDILRVTGQTESYQGEPELQVQSVEKLGQTDPVEPKKITATQLNDRSVEGQLVSIEGIVTELTEANGLIESIYVKDADGVIARIFIDGYITTDKPIKDLEVGTLVTAIGLASYDNTYAISHSSYARLRVRDRGEITVTVLTPTPTFPFTDVAEDSWYREAVEYMFYNKLVNGMTESTFAPETTMSRAMVVTILYRLAGTPAVEGKTQFSDVEPDFWYSDAVAWGFQKGIIKGIDATTFGPYEAVTREQMITFLYRYAQAMGYDVSIDPETKLDAFTDASLIYPYALDAVTWAVQEGIVNGMGNGLLIPYGTATRAQMSQIIMKFAKHLSDPA